MTGDELKKLRTMRGLSQAKLATALGRHTQTIASNEAKGEGRVSKWLEEAALDELTPREDASEFDVMARSLGRMVRNLPGGAVLTHLESYMLPGGMVAYNGHFLCSDRAAAVALETRLWEKYCLGDSSVKRDDEDVDPDSIHAMTRRLHFYRLVAGPPRKDG